MAVMTLDAIHRIQSLLDAHLRGLERPAAVLEAGCGRLKHFVYPDDAVISGLDVSQEQLDLNDNLHERFLGDVQTWKADRTWDVVVSMYVLEHLEDPGRTVDNMLRWTAPGGLLVIGVPNPRSLRGLVTKYTPFRFHELAYKWVYRRTMPPFPTVMAPDVEPARLRGRLGDCDLVYEGWAQERIGMPYALAYEGLIWLGKILTLGRWRPENMNWYVVARRR